MQENEFEKQVQQQMDELRLHPSDAVWPKIEAQIKKEKRRRWGIILFPVILIPGLYGAYVLMNRGNSNNDYKQATKTFTAKNKIDSTNLTTILSPDSIRNDQTFIKNKNSFAESNNEKSNRHLHKKIPAKLKFNSNHQITTTSEKDTSPFLKNEIDTTTIVIQNNVLNPQTQNSQEETIPVKEAAPDSANQNNKLSNEIIAGLTDDKQKNETKTDSNSKNLKASNKHLWNWGISFSGGISGIATNFRANQNNAQSYTTFPASGNLGYTPVFGPSPIISSIAFITGATAEKNILPKIIFSTGLNYKLFSTTNLVGFDSANTFRAYTLSSTHHNFFHYIDLPIAIRAQIGNSKKPSFYWSIGLSISQLIASSALQFNSAASLYYHDNSQFNKTQFGVNTGVDVALTSKQKISFLIGPYLNYNISKVAAQGYYNHNFIFIGLHTQFIFVKK